jgi:shikimate kinase
MAVDFLKKTNLYLIGMMGSGKTTLGRKLANRVGYRFLDTDALIEQTAQKPITDIFATEGEPAFRAIESQVLSQVCAHTNLVVATGGGIVTQPMNWSYLRHGIVIWLDVPVPVLVSRLSEDNSRPLLQSVSLRDKLNALLAERESLYAQADVRIPYEGQSIGKTCDRILTAIQQTLRQDPKLEAGEVVINQSCINTPVPPADLP